MSLTLRPWRLCVRHLIYKLCDLLVRDRSLVKIGELAEWSNAAVLKTVEVKASGGSNPSFSAMIIKIILIYDS